ncbi:hypothetical protein VTJ83DRAFT_41 [Remersonia thermophila]|uniref:Uncharacterized protein n=1 Tax=Remersonia thermophila TaxID=72144 RepID=A0ABR4DK01_9PEZI
MAIASRPDRLRSAKSTRMQDDTELARREYLWNRPDGARPDFAEKYAHGDDILVSWNALNNSIYDLWLTSWDLGRNPVVLCLKRSVNMSQDGNLHLVTSNPPTPELASHTRYVLRFKPPTGRGDFVASDPDMSSPGFLLVQPGAGDANADGRGLGVVVQSTASTTLATATSWATPSRSVATTVAETETNGVAEKPGLSLSPAAAAGLTIGLILGVALLVAIELWYLSWRRRRQQLRGEEEEEEEEGQEEEEEESGGVESQRIWKHQRRHEARDTFGTFLEVGKAERVLITEAAWMSPELPGDSTWGQRLVHELQGSGFGRSDSRAVTVNSSLVELDAEQRPRRQEG